MKKRLLGFILLGLFINASASTASVLEELVAGQKQIFTQLAKNSKRIKGGGICSLVATTVMLCIYANESSIIGNKIAIEESCEGVDTSMTAKFKRRLRFLRPMRYIVPFMVVQKLSL